MCNPARGGVGGICNENMEGEEMNTYYITIKADTIVCNRVRVDTDKTPARAAKAVRKDYAGKIPPAYFSWAVYDSLRSDTPIAVSENWK